MSSKHRTSQIRRRTASAVAVIAALASAAPIAQASAATSAVPVPAVQGLYGLPGFVFPVLVPGATFAKGPTVIGDAFNGGTTVCVSIAASACSTNGSP
jgi:hypothetical protein